MKFGADTEIVHFQVVPLEALHNLSMLLMFVVTLYLMHCRYILYREVVIVLHNICQRY